MDVRSQIEALLSAHRVVLFMKGSRAQPACGFSARVVDVLDAYLEEYETVDVLADEAIRQGIKDYAQWPTIPQLFVDGKLVGGADIVRELRVSGELATLLGAAPAPARVPEVVVTEAALAALLAHWDGDGKPGLRLEVDRQHRAALSFDAPTEEDLVLAQDAVSIVIDPSSARRADGVRIDWHESAEGAGFKIDNPNAPPRPKEVSPQALSAWMREGKPFELFDVRTEDERALATIAPSTLLDDAGKARLEALDRGTTVVLFCHHGMRSRVAADHCVRMGFRDVYNLSGGIVAWSVEVDPSVPRY